MLDFDDDVVLRSGFDGEYVTLPKAAVLTQLVAYVALLAFQYRAIFLVLKAEHFELSLKGPLKMLDFDDDVIALQRSRRRICCATESCGAHVGLSTLRSSLSSSAPSSWS